MQLGWGRSKLCSLARIARFAPLDGFQQTRRSVSQDVAACGQWPVGRPVAPCVLHAVSEVQSTRPSYWRHYPTLIWSQSRAAITSPPPKGSPATFNFARFQTSKTSYLETHTVLDAAGSSIPGCGDPRASFRHHLVVIVFSILCSSTASIPISPSTSIFLPPATPSTSLISLILNYDHGQLHIQVVSFALSFFAIEVLRRESSILHPRTKNHA
jgi:hypothetical protein